MTDTTTGESATDTPESARKAAARRRASRAAGPASGTVPAVPEHVVVETPRVGRVRPVKRVGPPPRRQPHRALVAGLALGVTAFLVAAMAGVVAVLFTQQGD